MKEQENFNQKPLEQRPVYFDELEDNRPFKERFQETVETWRPYILALWDKRKKFILINTIVLILALGYLLFLTHPYFDSTVVILPEYGSSSSMLSQLSGLASMVGISTGKTSPTEIYQKLLTSEAVIAPVVYHKFKTEKFDKPVNLIEYFEIEPDESLPPELRKRQMFLELLKDITENRINTDIDRTTQVLTVTVRMPESKLSAEVVNLLVKSLNNYVINQRKSFAKEQRIYLDKRIKQVKDSLRIAEEKLKEFREQNRSVAQSPELLLEQARLTRSVDIKQTVYIELMKQYELVKLEEVKDTPVINVQEYAKDPIKKTGPKRAISLILIMFFSGIITGFYYMFRDEILSYVKIIKEKPSESKS